MNQEIQCCYENCVCKNTKLKKFSVTKDWKGRKYHKKCFNQMQKMNELKLFCKLMDEKHGTDVSSKIYK